MHGERPDSPLDIVGDVHGELGALQSLLKAAGYGPSGEHPQGRTLVFVGDLIDRGPDSPGVVDLVRRLIEAQRAVAILGNHELNLLRGERKYGNDWFWNEGSERDARFARCVAVTSDAERHDLMGFFAGLPLALSRSDLRVTHAAWHGPSVQALSALRPGSSLGEEFRRFEALTEAHLEDGGWLAGADAERAKWNIHQQDFDVPMLEATAYCDEVRQMSNPIRVITSGVERRADRPFFTSGQWRFAERVRWWSEYAEDVPVVVGHYWRQYVAIDRADLGKGDPDLFDGIPPASWLGRHGRVFCIDYSVGGRYQERLSGKLGARTRLALMRWPERDLVFETGEVVKTTHFGR